MVVERSVEAYLSAGRGGGAVAALVSAGELGGAPLMAWGRAAVLVGIAESGAGGKVGTG